MKYEDLEFTIMDKNNQIVNCNIVSLIPKNDYESYVVFIDDTRDENDNVVLKYGKLVNVDDEYELRTGVEPYELEYIMDKFHEDLIDVANSIIENN